MSCLRSSERALRISDVQFDGCAVPGARRDMKTTVYSDSSRDTMPGSALMERFSGESAKTLEAFAIQSPQNGIQDLQPMLLPPLLNHVSGFENLVNQQAARLGTPTQQRNEINRNTRTAGIRLPRSSNIAGDLGGLFQLRILIPARC